MNFHTRLRKLQTKNGLTFKAIADACGVSYQTVQQWCKDDGTYPKIENLEALAGVLKTTPWFLLFGIYASGEAPIKRPFPPLTDEAEELIQCVVRLDGDDSYSRELFDSVKGLLSIALRDKRPEDAQAGLDLPSLTSQMIKEGEQHAQDVLARDLPSGEKHEPPKRRGR
ncbi:helix-turn-helix domain-containing protein [Paraburkholderia sediminicola]|uniref:helix-turn-helix domain-containing protein n=1 Tax=Paraburkholderia sediminicola TaxID=458836 RepID=UPI0038B86D1A